VKGKGKISDKNRCVDTTTGAWTGEQYRCELQRGHKGAHRSQGLLWGELEADFREWSKKTGRADEAAREAFAAGWHAGARNAILRHSKT
jgi:hypothetical protein